VKFANWIIGICLFTASFDVFLNVNLGGNVRFTQFVMLLFLLIAMAKILQEGRFLWPRGAGALAVWIACLILFLPQSGSWLIGLQMLGLLLFSVAGMLAILQVYGLSSQIETLMKLYMASFVFIALAGLLQFALPLFGLHSFLVSEWIIHGKLARINGFMIEPSYYATYLIIGWILLIELRISKARIATGRLWGWATVLMTVALILCTSKSGWVVMVIEVLARLAPLIGRGMRNVLRQASAGRMMIPLPRSSAIVKGVLGCLLLVAIAIAASSLWLSSHVSATVFLNGSGLANTPAHSVLIRLRDTRRTWRIFTDHPFIGRGLGGVPVANAEYYGIHVTNMDMARLWWGFPVLLDILAASGIFAFIPFLIFLYANTFGVYRKASLCMPEERAKWLRALARAMIFEWLMLLIDQNILRVYLWYHFAMVTTVAYHLEFAPASEPALSLGRVPLLSRRFSPLPIDPGDLVR
jgi:hypothetical protein